MAPTANRRVDLICSLIGNATSGYNQIRKNLDMSDSDRIPDDNLKDVNLDSSNIKEVVMENTNGNEANRDEIQLIAGLQQRIARKLSDLRYADGESEGDIIAQQTLLSGDPLPRKPTDDSSGTYPYASIRISPR